MLNTLSSVSVRESRIRYLCDAQWFRDTASRGPTTIVAPESQFRTFPSDHDSIVYPRMSASGESSTNGNHLESSNEGSSIDHQVTIYLYAQNITMVPTNETCLHIHHSAAPIHNLTHAAGSRLAPSCAAAVRRPLRDRTCFDHHDEVIPSVAKSVKSSSADLWRKIDSGHGPDWSIYRRLPTRARFSL
ncbi:hypothetical protein F511_06606 [Dorcoceras hygrometricum]|uniref:Uncharacterized protein n=1 Tax=Dorcoceras hygrometricum TaxID=472368 RepID=A0A2Z7B413_9LAMI|nr:hypothetical protein F511_06606 [Dorcoceras hygrometricum]